MRSPVHESPGRDVKTRHSSQGDSPSSLGKRIDKNQRKRKRLNDHPDYSGRNPDGPEDLSRDRRQISSDTKMRVDEQLREKDTEIKVLESDKRQLEIYLEDKIKEVDTLTLKIHELEIQLSKEKEERKRFATKIKKFIKSHNRHLRLQDELKRSHAQLQKLGEQLDLDSVGTSQPGSEDDPKLNTSDDDVGGGSVSPLNGGHMKSSSHGKRARIPESYETPNQVNPSVGGLEIKKGRLKKYKVSERALSLPPTGIAAHAMDEDVEVVETDEKLPAVGAVPADGETEFTEKVGCAPLLPPPPPPIRQNAYAKYKGADENVDIDGIDEQAVYVDIV